MNGKQVTIRCNDGQEAAVFSRYDYDNLDAAYEMSFEDSYVGGDYRGFFGRIKRAWKAFIDKPVVYTGVFIEDKDRMRKFLTDCLTLIDEDDYEQIKDIYKELGGNDEEPFLKGLYGD